MGHYFPGGGVVEVQDIGYHVLLRLLNNSLFLALAHHLHYLLLGDRVLKAMGVYSQQTQEAVHYGVGCS